MKAHPYYPGLNGSQGSQGGSNSHSKSQDMNQVLSGPSMVHPVLFIPKIQIVYTQFASTFVSKLPIFLDGKEVS